MTALDTAKSVLAKASLFDQSFATPDIGIAVAWSEALGDVNQRDALAAVTTHYSQPGPRRIMPGDVLAEVRKIRAERLRSADSSLFEPHNVDPNDPLAYAREKRRRVHAIANGEQVSVASVELTPRPVEELLERAVRPHAMPPAQPVADVEKKRAAESLVHPRAAS